ncbi:flagellar biosynthetic protein FliR [Marinomonas sp. 15G1-11]|uniref:Flagellar biosynthetic protein FliR n=1 Tax=Marinomonas phaeophyticola TaxID=3004091 RepID=A0ABT4JZV7_9GAMM|nr:flagellar biosynthetic protein FliR [Marinomonas sp. 15G1-11]MCZ2723303.1 flagellar biosynthetic protein FliR [Marinomonas sp. 15G1-11]
MLELDPNQLMELAFSFLLPFFRIGAFLMALPLIGSNLVSVPVRLAFAFIFSIIITPVIGVPEYEAISPSMIVLIVEQLIVGIVLGFVITILFQVFSLAGQLAAMKAGLGFAMSNDPANGISVATLGQYYLSMAGLAFIGTNGHHVMFEYLVESFTYWPIGSGFESQKYYDLVNLGSWLFEKALLMVLPLAIAVLIMNLSFGIVAKASPQLNIFALGFPVIMLFSMFFFWVMLGEFLSIYKLFFMEIMTWLQSTWGLRLNG